LATFAGALPYFYLRIKLRAIRIEGSYEAEGLITELINQYKINYYNMVEAIDRTIPYLNNYPHSKKALFRLALTVKDYSTDEELENSIQEFVYSINTEWSTMLSMNINLAIKNGSNVTESIEDILKDLKTLKSVIVDDISKSSDYSDCPKTRHEIINGIKAKSVLIAPIMFEKGVFGTLTLNQCNKTRKWSQDDVQMMENIAFQIGIAINQSYLLEKIKGLAIKDELTGLINKRNFNERISAEIERAKRHSGSLSLAIFDIDFFKKFNDTWGHLAGDYVLRELGKIIRNNIRKSDIAARIGGEEFALILPETDIHNGYEFLERLRNTIQSSNFDFQGKKLKVTISGGIIDVGQIKNKNIDINSLIQESIEKADGLLYKAKKHGRNRICMQ
jgi:diguanylate cyclase (GGDEF)-like protein